MKKSVTTLGGALLVLVAGLEAATTTFVASDNQFNNTSTVGTGGGTSFTVVSTSGIGTPSYTINYSFTADLTSIGGPASATTTFFVTYSTSDGNIPNQNTIGVDGASDSSNNLESGESITAAISFTPSGYFTGIDFGAIQAYGPGTNEDENVEAQVTTSAGITSQNAGNPLFTINEDSFILENIDSGTDTFGLGFVQYRITAEVIPEPTGAALLLMGMAGLSLRRKRG